MNHVDDYKFANADRNKPFLKKIDFIEKERFAFIAQILDFEQYLFDHKILDKVQFGNIKTHVGFKNICDALIPKGRDRQTVDKIIKARNEALHGDIPKGITFSEVALLLEKVKK